MFNAANLPHSGGNDILMDESEEDYERTSSKDAKRRGAGQIRTGSCDVQGNSFMRINTTWELLADPRPVERQAWNGAR